MPKRTWTDDDLRTAVASSTTFRSVRERLGLRGSHWEVQQRIRELQLDTSHFERPRRIAISDEQLRIAVAQATGTRHVLELLNLEPGNGNYVCVPTAMPCRRHIVV